MQCLPCECLCALMWLAGSVVALFLGFVAFGKSKAWEIFTLGVRNLTSA